MTGFHIRPDITDPLRTLCPSSSKEPDDADGKGGDEENDGKR